jgi:hypothetical protein
MRRPFAPVPYRFPPQLLRDAAEGAPGSKLAYPPRLVVHGSWVDPGADEELLDRAIALFGAKAQQVSLQD